MKIAFLHLYTFRIRRGIETLISSLGNALSAKGVDVTLISASPTIEPLIKPARAVKLHTFPTFRYYEAKTIVPFYLADLLRQEYDILNIFFADFGEAPSILWARYWRKFKLNLYFCYSYAAAPHRYHTFQTTGLADSATRLLADSMYVARDAQDFFRRPVQVVPAGTDPLYFKPDVELRRQIRARYGFTENETVLLNVSRLEERKGIQHVLNALSRLDSTLSIRYLIMGDGPFKPILEDQVRSLGLTKSVIFGGVTSNLAAVYNCADIFVMLSENEANSVACLEAMASGLPALVSNDGGFLETVDLKTGRLVERQDTTGIAGIIHELATDETFRLTLGQNARQRVVNEFSWDRIADKAIEIFEAELA